MPPDLADIDFTELRRLKPEMAGLLCDWSIGPKEIAATIVDLALRDYLYIQGDVVARTGKASGLEPFEKEFIKTVFGGEERLNAGEMMDIAFKKKASELTRIICRGAIDCGIVDPEFQGKLAEAVKKAFTGLYGIEPRSTGLKPGFYVNKDLKDPALIRLAEGIKANSDPLLSKKTEPMKIPSWLTKNAKLINSLVSVACMLDLAVIVLSMVTGNGLLAILCFLPLFVLLPAAFLANTLNWAASTANAIEGRMLAESGGDYDRIILTEEGRRQRGLSQQARQFMRAYPQTDENLAGELAPYAVAFGIGGTWVRKFGGLNARLMQFVEDAEDGRYETLYNLIDWQEYVKEFQ